MATWSKPFFSCNGWTCIMTALFPWITSIIVGCRIGKPVAAIFSVFLIFSCYILCFSRDYFFVKLKVLHDYSLSTTTAYLYLTVGLLVFIFMLGWIIGISSIFAPPPAPPTPPNAITTNCSFFIHHLCSLLKIVARQTQNGPLIETELFVF